MLGVGYVDAPAPDVRGKIVVGLDTWVWRRFAESARTRTGLYATALAELEKRVESGQVVVPLAATVMFEVQAWSSALRIETAAIAGRLSKWLTFLPPHIRIEQEMDSALRQMFGRPLVLPPRLPDIGWGAHFSMTGQSKRLALRGSDDEIQAFVAHYGAQSVELRLEDLEDFGERSFVEGPTDQEVKELRMNYGYRPEEAWGAAIERMDRHVLMQENLAKSVDLSSRPEDLVAVSELGIEINETLNRRLRAAGIAPRELMNRGRTGLTELLDLMPSSVVRRAIVQRALKDRGRQFSVNDVGDGDLYATVVPASEVVVAERATIQALSTPDARDKITARVIGGRELPLLPSILDSLIAARECG